MPVERVPFDLTIAPKVVATLEADGRGLYAFLPGDDREPLARAYRLEVFFAWLGRELRDGKTCSPENLNCLERAWEIVHPSSAKARRIGIMRFIALIADDDEDDRLARDETMRNDPALMAVLRVWRGIRPGAKRSAEGKRDSKWRLLAAMSRGTSYEASAKTWENDWQEASGGSRRARVITPT